MSDQSSDDDSSSELQIPRLHSDEDCEYTDEIEGDEPSDRKSGTESENGSDIINNSEQNTSEWIEFNKKVISMRPLFKSAKVQFVHKASRAIKILKKKKGSPEQVEKNNKKAERLVREIAYINTLKKDVVPKFALLHSKEEITTIVNSGASTMEYRAKAKIASMPKILKAAENYHMEHPDWRDSLYKLIQLAGKNMKKKRRKIRGKSNKGSKINEENRQNARKQQLKKGAAHDGGDVDAERFGVSNFPEPPPGLEDTTGRDGDSDEEYSQDEDQAESAESDDGSSSEEVGIILRTSQSKRKRADSKNTVMGNARSDLGQTDTLKTIPAKHKLASEPEASTKFNYKKAKLENGASLNKNPKSPAQQKISKSHRTHSSDGENGCELESNPKSNVDPFFMTSDNKEYKTLWKVEPADSFKNKKPNEPEFMFKNARPFTDVLSGKNKKGPPKSKVPKLDGKGKKPVGGKGQQSEVPVENLHPSWQAKKKMSNVAFQGKKIVFDED